MCVGILNLLRWIIKTIPVANATLRVLLLKNDSHFYLRNLFIVLLLDSLLTDDEPIWEPIEWSLFQTWIFFVFLFAWMGEVMISARFGNHVGRDKRVWLAWYKSFWNIEIWYLISFGLASLFVIVPFFYEITYRIAFVVSWWDWFSREFFSQFLAILFLMIFATWILIWKLQWMVWKFFFLIISTVQLTLLYLLYWQFLNVFFAFFTDPIWFQKTRLNDFVQLSHEPNKWGWGFAKRDHFTYHRVSTVFWFKNDGPFAETMLLINLFFLLSLFFVNFFWLTLLRRTYSIMDIPNSFFNYSASAIRHFFWTFTLIIVLVLVGFVMGYWRFPVEYLWMLSATSWCKATILYLFFFFRP